MTDEDKKSTGEKPAEAPKKPRGRPKKAAASSAATKAAAAKKPAVKKSPAAKKTTAQKTAAKKTTTKKTTAKKPAAKKPVAKKPAAKKTTLSKSAASKSAAAKTAKPETKATTSSDNAAPADDAKDITVPTEAIMARNSEETSTMNESNSTDTGGTSTAQAVGGDSFYKDTAERDWSAVAFRLAYLAFYGLVAWATTWAILLLTVVNFVAYVVMDEQNEQINGWTKSLAAYLAQIYRFFTAPDSKKPFPLDQSEFPSGD